MLIDLINSRERAKLCQRPWPFAVRIKCKFDPRREIYRCSFSYDLSPRVYPRARSGHACAVYSTSASLCSHAESFATSLNASFDHPRIPWRWLLLQTVKSAF